MDEATYVIPQVSELAMDLIEEVKKIKGKEKRFMRIRLLMIMVYSKWKW